MPPFQVVGEKNSHSPIFCCHIIIHSTLNVSHCTSASLQTVCSVRPDGLDYSPFGTEELHEESKEFRLKLAFCL